MTKKAKSQAANAITRKTDAMKCATETSPRFGCPHCPVYLLLAMRTTDAWEGPIASPEREQSSLRLSAKAQWPRRASVLEQRYETGHLERWAPLFANLFLAGPIPSVGLMLIPSEDHTFLGIYGDLFFCIGVVLKLGLRRFRTNLRLGLRLIETCFYVASAATFVGSVYRWLTNQAYFASVPEISLVVVDFAIMIGFSSLSKEPSIT